MPIYKCKCGYCGSNNLEELHEDIYDLNKVTSIACDDCGAVWTIGKDGQVVTSCESQVEKE